MAGEGRVRGSWAYDTYCIARPPERPLTQPSPTGWGEEQEKTPHLNLLPQDGERSKRRPLISIFSHRMGRGAREDPSSQSSPTGWGEEAGAGRGRAIMSPFTKWRG